MARKVSLVTYDEHTGYTMEVSSLLVKPEETRGTIVCDDITADAINTQSLSTRTLNVSSMMSISSLGVDKSVQIFGNGIKGDAVSILNGNMSIQDGSLSVNGNVTIVSSNQNASDVSISDGQIKASFVSASYISCLTQEKTGYCMTDNLVATNATITNATISESINLPKKDKIKIDSSDFEIEITKIVKSVITSVFADELNNNIAIVRNLITSRFNAELQANKSSIQDIITSRFSTELQANKSRIQDIVLTYLRDGRIQMCSLRYNKATQTASEKPIGSVFEECDEYSVCDSGFVNEAIRFAYDQSEFLLKVGGSIYGKSGKWVALSVVNLPAGTQYSAPFLALRVI
jgi:hypothetical protein